MNEQDLPGATVMVEPLFWDDPYNRQGQIAKVTAFDIAENDFFVEFEDQQPGLYSANALLVLQEPDKIYEALDRQSGFLSTELTDDLMNIAILQQYGGKEQVKTALEIVQKNENAQLYGTQSLEDALGMQKSYKIGR